jgi:HNH endonuclease
MWLFLLNFLRNIAYTPPFDYNLYIGEIMLIPAEDFNSKFPFMENKDLAVLYNVSKATIGRWARGNSLKKDPSHKSAMQAKNATGQVHSAEVREKMRQKAIGRVMSDETKSKIIATKIKNNSIPKGENHPNWKGGRPWERFKNPEYIAWRNKVLERDNYICQQCKRQCKKYEKGLAAHHIKSYAQYPEFRYDVENGVTMCRQCHMLLHGKPFEIKQVLCACGCGKLIKSYDIYGRPREYINHHYIRTMSEIRQKQLSADLILCGCGCGKLVKPFDKNGKPHKFLRGHSSRVNKIKVNIPVPISCACGCGTIIQSFSKWGNKVTYVRGHHMRKNKC